MTALLLLVLALLQQNPNQAVGGASRQQADRVMQRFADCMIDRSGVRRELETALRDGASRTLANLRGFPECLGRAGGSRASFQPAVLRGALYEAMYRREFARKPIDFREVAPQRIEEEFEGAITPDVRAIRVIGNCVVLMAPDEARALALSDADRDAGAAALKAMVPSLSVCVPEGVELRFSGTMLRGMNAEALYKLSSNARAQVSSN